MLLRLGGRRGDLWLRAHGSGVLSAGVPIIAVESGAIPEIVHNGVNGILTSQDPKEISAQIWNLISNSSLDLANREKKSVGNAPNSNELGMNLKHISVYKEILL